MGWCGVLVMGGEGMRIREPFHGVPMISGHAPHAVGSQWPRPDFSQPKCSSMCWPFQPAYCCCTSPWGEEAPGWCSSVTLSNWQCPSAELWVWFRPLPPEPLEQRESCGRGRSWFWRLEGEWREFAHTCYSVHVGALAHSLWVCGQHCLQKAG